MRRARLVLAIVAFAGCLTVAPGGERLTPGIFLEPQERLVLPPGVELRALSDGALGLTKNSEGFVPTLYNDVAGYCTIGYGHLVFRKQCDGSAPPRFQRGITEAVGAELLREDMQTAQWKVMSAVLPTMTDGQYGALCDFVYNVGGRNFAGSTLLKAINAGDLAQVPAQFRRWVMAGEKEWPGLKLRREREIELFFQGIRQAPSAPGPDEALPPIDIRQGE